MNIKIYNNPREIAEAVSLKLMSAIKLKSELTEKFYLAISGGSTPKILFERLSQDPFRLDIMWQFLHIFWVDERCVPPDHAESNYGMTKKILLDNINIPAENIHRIKGEENPAAEIISYSAEIKQYVYSKNTLPSFDWILLGMGTDGHTASLFPDSEFTETSDEICGTSFHPATKQKRISLTQQVINNAESISFLVTGKDKTEVLNKILNKNPGYLYYPAAKIQSVAGKIEWLVDKDAAGEIISHTL